MRGRESIDDAQIAEKGAPEGKGEKQKERLQLDCFAIIMMLRKEAWDDDERKVRLYRRIVFDTRDGTPIPSVQIPASLLPP